MENLLKNLDDLREQVIKTCQILDIDRKKSKANNLRIKTSNIGFWDNHKKAIEISKKLEELEDEINQWDTLRQKIRELEELVAVAQKENDQSIDSDIRKTYKSLKEEYEKLEFYVLFSGKYDDKNVVISIYSGAGGVDAQDWAEILERMILKFAEKQGWKFTILNKTYGNEAGIKNVSIRIAGKWVYGYLRSESGVHRLVRISPFDAESMRHTSFALVEVIPELDEIGDIKIKEEDIKINTFRSSGPGGQGVNTTDSAVRITHLPTKTVATCQNERSQHQNKESAMKILKSKLFKIQEEEKEKEKRKLRGETQKVEWGNQIRSYIMQPYKMIKDHRTKHETQNIDKVLDGDLDSFIEAYLRFDR